MGSWLMPAPLCIHQHFTFFKAIDKAIPLLSGLRAGFSPGSLLSPVPLMTYWHAITSSHPLVNCMRGWISKPHPVWCEQPQLFITHGCLVNFVKFDFFSPPQFAFLCPFAYGGWGEETPLSLWNSAGLQNSKSKANICWHLHHQWEEHPACNLVSVYYSYGTDGCRWTSITIHEVCLQVKAKANH